MASCLPYIGRVAAGLCLSAAQILPGHQRFSLGCLAFCDLHSCRRRHFSRFRGRKVNFLEIGAHRPHEAHLSRHPHRYLVTLMLLAQRAVTMHGTWGLFKILRPWWYDVTGEPTNHMRVPSILPQTSVIVILSHVRRRPERRRHRHVAELLRQGAAVLLRRGHQLPLQRGLRRHARRRHHHRGPGVTIMINAALLLPRRTRSGC